MCRKKNNANSKKTMIATSVTEKEKNNITRLAEEQKLTRAQYIRQTLELANQMQVNYPAISTEIVCINLLLENNKDNMDKETYKQLKSNISNLIKLLH